jgi:predicted nucleotidyltransferase
MNILERLPEITERIVKTSNPEKIILFGSYARGDFGADSDLDLLIIIPDVKHLRAESVRVRRALRGLLVPIDVIIATPEQIKRLGNVTGLVYQAALADGKVVYERTG